MAGAMHDLVVGEGHTAQGGAMQATGYRGAMRYQGRPAVTDGNLITAAATASVDFAYHIFKRLAV
jgi:hypothetical protein